MKNPLLLLATAVCLCSTSLLAQDQCKPIGWATRDGRTGGAVQVTGGGTATPIIVSDFKTLLQYVQDNQPRVLYINGTLGSGWSGTTGDRLEVKASNKTIIGMKPGTILKAPIHITNNATNIIVRNIVINGPGSNQDQAWDNLNIEGGAKNIWIDHCEFWDGQDGNADVVKGADNVTFTWNIFGYKKKSDHNLSNLIGSSDNEPVSVNKLNVTFMFNWWKAATQRKPRCRYGNVHTVNNLFTGDPAIQSGSILGASAGFDCQMLTENNHFINESTPIYTGNAAGTSAQEVVGNVFTSCTGNQTGTGKSFTPPYEYKSFLLPASQVSNAVMANAGATLTSPTSCGTPSSSSVAQSSSSAKPSSSSVAQSSSSAKPSSSSVAHNAPPAITFKSPDSTIPLTAPANILVEVQATDSDGSIANVKLYLGESLVRQENGAPYIWNDQSQDTLLQNMQPGPYTLRAVATDNSGNQTEESLAITIMENTTSLLLHIKSQHLPGSNREYDLNGRVK